MGEAARNRTITEDSQEMHLARILDVYRRPGETVREGAAA